MKFISLFLCLLLVLPESVRAQTLCQHNTIAPSSAFSKDTNAWMEDVFLVISDVNDTLISDEAGPKQPELRQAINELLDLGIIFTPLTGMGQQTIKKKFMDPLGPLSRPGQVLLGVQNGGTIINWDSGEILSEHLFPSEVQNILRDKVRFYISEVLQEIGRPDLEWEFQPPEGRALRSILYVSFKEKPKQALEILQRLEEKLKGDSDLANHIVKDGRTIWQFNLTERHLVISPMDKAVAAQTILRNALEKTNLKGQTVLVLGDSGGKQGNDSHLLSLKTLDGHPVKAAYVGKDDAEWAKAEGIAVVAHEKTGPAASLEIFKALAEKIKSHLRQEIVEKTVWKNVLPDYKLLMEQTFLSSAFLDKTLRKFYDLSLRDVEAPEIQFLGRGNENYVSQMTLTVKPEAVNKLPQEFRGNRQIQFLVVVPHHNLKQVHRMQPEIQSFLSNLEIQRLMDITDIAGKMDRRRFPLFGESVDGIFSRELFEGEEVGQIVQRITEIKELEDLLYECSRTQVDFWAHAVNREWLPMVHDDDIIAAKGKDGHYKAYLPDLNTPIFHVPPFRIFMEMIYLNYELTQIFYEKHYGRHSVLRPHDIQILMKVVLQSFLDVFGDEKGVEVIHEILGDLSHQPVSISRQRRNYFHHSAFAFRFMIEEFLAEKHLPLPKLPYGRPENPERLTWQNTTAVVDELREHIPVQLHKAIQGLNPRRPYDNKTIDDPDLLKALQMELMGRDEAEKSFQRVSEIVLGISLTGPEKVKDLFPKNTYTYRLLESLAGKKSEGVKWHDLQEVVFALLHDFNLREATPADWIRLYRLTQKTLRINTDTGYKDLNLYTPVPNDLNKKIKLKLNEDLGKGALLWHASSFVRQVYSFDVYVDGEFAGVLDFTLLPSKLVLERFRLNKRGRGLGTALAKWLKDFVQERNITHIETFEFIHFIHIHVLGKIFQPITVKEQNRVYRPITEGEAQRLVIENPTGHILRLTVPPKVRPLITLEDSAARFLEQAA